MLRHRLPPTVSASFSGYPAAGLRPREAWTLAFIALVIILLQGAILLNFGPWRPEVLAHSTLLTSDSQEYEGLARCICEQGSFCDNTLRTPGYPLFIAAVYAAAGNKPWVVLLAQVGVAVATAMLVFGIGRLIHSARVGLIAAALWAVDPPSMFAPSMLLADGLFVLILLAALFIYLRGLQRASLRLALMSGLLLGLATLTRPVGQYYALILALAVLCWTKQEMRWRGKFASLLILAFLAALSPWVYRNHSQYQSLKLSTVQGITLLEWQVAEYLSRRDGAPIDVVRLRLRSEAIAMGYIDQGNPFANEAVEQRLAMKYVWRDPAGFAIATLRGMAFMYLNLGTSAILERTAPTYDPAPTGAAPTASTVALPFSFKLDRIAERATVAAIIVPVLVLQFVLFVIGTRELWRLRQRFFLGLVFLAIAYFTLTVGANGTLRFRLPLVPLYLLVGAVAVDSLLRRPEQGVFRATHPTG